VRGRGISKEAGDPVEKGAGEMAVVGKEGVAGYVTAEEDYGVRSNVYFS